MGFDFFPLTGLQFGHWLSSSHREKQLFLYEPEQGTLVFVVLHPEQGKELAKWSPYAAPVSREGAELPGGSLQEH